MKRSVHMERAAARPIMGAVAAACCNALLIVNTQSADRDNAAANLAHLLVVRDGGAGADQPGQPPPWPRKTRPAYTLAKAPEDAPRRYPDEGNQCVAAPGELHNCRTGYRSGRQPVSCCQFLRAFSRSVAAALRCGSSWLSLRKRSRRSRAASSSHGRVCLTCRWQHSSPARLAVESAGPWSPGGVYTFPAPFPSSW